MAKKKTGLIISLVAGGVVLLAALAVLLFLWPGLLVSAAPVTGVWYSESRTEAVQFSPGGVFHAFTHYGEFGGDYQYDKAAGKGRILMNDDKEFDFIVDGDTLYVNNMGAFDRAAYGFDVGSFIGNVVEAPGED